MYHNSISIASEISRLTERQKVDRRRVDDAFFQYAILRASSWYPHKFNLSSLPLHGDTRNTLSMFTTIYHGAFMEKYSGRYSQGHETAPYAYFVPSITEHHCAKPGCSQALVVDGNMKNHRNVCFATNAGYVEFNGLPGRVRTGCPNSPSYASLYCSLHKPMLAVAHHGDADGNPINLTGKSAEKEPVGLVVGKRETRASTLYQVKC